MESTMPFTSGSQVVILYGEVALKLKMLFLKVVVPPWLSWVKVPTAYMVLPHCTSWRTCSAVVPLLASAGVPLAGAGDTGPAWSERALAAGWVVATEATGATGPPTASIPPSRQAAVSNRQSP